MNVIRMYISPINQLVKPHGNECLSKWTCKYECTLVRSIISATIGRGWMSPANRVSIRKTFSQFSRNETQNFSFFVHQCCAKNKNNNLRNHSQKSFCAKLPYSAFAKLKFCAIPQKSNSWWWCVFLRIQFWKNLVLECLPWSLLHNWPIKLRRVQITQFSRQFCFGHAYFQKLDSSGIGYFLALFYMRLKRFQKFD